MSDMIATDVVFKESDTTMWFEHPPCCSDGGEQNRQILKPPVTMRQFDFDEHHDDYDSRVFRCECGAWWTGYDLALAKDDDESAKRLAMHWEESLGIAALAKLTPIERAVLGYGPGGKTTFSEPGYVLKARADLETLAKRLLDTDLGHLCRACVGVGYSRGRKPNRHFYGRDLPKCCACGGTGKR